jgi:hypothetical protein
MKIRHKVIGSAPTEESYAKPGDKDYVLRSRRECTVFKRMLRRLFPVPGQFDATVCVRLNCRNTICSLKVCHEFAVCHDERTSREVIIEFNEADCQATEYVDRVCRGIPKKWDEIANFELAWLERHERTHAEIFEGIMDTEVFASEKPTNGIPQLPLGWSVSELLSDFLLCAA